MTQCFLILNIQWIIQNIDNMIIVKPNGKKIEYVLKEYRQKLNDTGIHKELRDRKRFKKKSAKRRDELQKARYLNGKGKEF